MYEPSLNSCILEILKPGCLLKNADSSFSFYANVRRGEGEYQFVETSELACEWGVLDFSLLKWRLSKYKVGFKSHTVIFPFSEPQIMLLVEH